MHSSNWERNKSLFDRNPMQCFICFSSPLISPIGTFEIAGNDEFLGSGDGSHKQKSLSGQSTLACFCGLTSFKCCKERGNFPSSVI
ncbi:unnamed protein product [Pocillopora meandrina]|uniref:Uncharacterized protein n=1 Tax=Pocillopora meandrina TaxID=46732 RepID=A0AAU9X2K5_9CNID|nr:unnamed protein product [Pocillopora meandrina]